jgi:hypothetical protein
MKYLELEFELEFELVLVLVLVLVLTGEEKPASHCPLRIVVIAPVCPHCGSPFNNVTICGEITGSALLLHLEASPWTATFFPTLTFQ